MATRSTTKKPPVEELAAAVRPTALTAEVLRDLRRPFTVDAIRFKPQVMSKTKPEAMATFYIDARLAAERLNAVVGPEAWSESYRVLFEDNAQAHMGFQFPVECALTVFGVTKVDVGVYQKSSADSMALKSAYSDALKRASVKFGIGVYLYGLPNLWATVKVGANGKAQGFDAAGEKKLRAGYLGMLKTIEARFGPPIDHGDLSDPEHEPPVEDAAPEAPAAPPAPPEDLGQGEPGSKPKRDGRIHVLDKEQIVGMVALAREAGFSDEEVAKILSNERDVTGGHYRKKWLTDQLQYLNGVIAEKAAA